MLRFGVASSAAIVIPVLIVAVVPVAGVALTAVAAGVAAGTSLIKIQARIQTETELRETTKGSKSTRAAISMTLIVRLDMLR